MLFRSMEEVLAKLDKLDQGQKQIRSAIQNLKQCNAKIAEFDQRLAQLERVSREKNIVMYGLEEAGKEDWEEITNKVEEFLKASFGFTYRVVDLADRIGVYKKDKSRPIRIKFVTVRFNEIRSS